MKAGCRNGTGYLQQDFAEPCGGQLLKSWERGSGRGVWILAGKTRHRQMTFEIISLKVSPVNY